MAEIYKVTNVKTGNVYIGQTKHSMSIRKDSHLRATENGSTLTLHNAIRKHGQKMFMWSVECVCSEDDLNDKETLIIEQYDSFNNGYNMTTGGHSTVFTEEVLKKISETSTGESNGRYGRSNYEIWVEKYGKDEADIRQAKRSGKMSDIVSGDNNPMFGVSVYDVWVEKYGKDEANRRQTIANEKNSKSNSGINHRMYGKQHTSETKRKISEKSSKFNKTRIGKTLEEIYGEDRALNIKERISINNSGENHHNYGKTYEEIYGVDRTKELKDIISKHHSGENNYWYGKGHLISGENNPFYGKTHSDETKEKIRQKRIGTKHSDESKLNMKLARISKPPEIRIEEYKRWYLGKFGTDAPSDNIERIRNKYIKQYTDYNNITLNLEISNG
jgi:group I intron endonuclease